MVAREGSTRERLLAWLAEVGAAADADIDIAETALVLGALDRPGVDLEPYRRHLSEISEASAQATSASAGIEAQLQALRYVILRRRGYTGDAETYDDIRNANLTHVIDRRRGLPVALGVLYIHAAGAFGGKVVGLSFPSHFLARIESRGQRAIFDPFDGARTVDIAELRRKLKDIAGEDAEIGPDVYSEVGKRDVLVRLQSNIKMRALSAGDLDRTLAVLETLTTLVPHRSEFWWEAALVHYQKGSVRTAIRLLEQFLSGSDADDGVEQVEELLRRLKGRVN